MYPVADKPDVWNPEALAGLCQAAVKAGIETGELGAVYLGEPVDTAVLAAELKAILGDVHPADPVWAAAAKGLVALGDIQWKGTIHRFEPHLHPRDGRGRFAHVPGVSIAGRRMLRGLPEKRGGAKHRDAQLARAARARAHNAQLRPRPRPFGKDELADRANAIEALRTSGIDRQWSTQAVWDNLLGRKGAYIAERHVEQESKILGPLRADRVNVPREHRAIIMAGLPGSGKSTAIRMLAADLGIDLDDHGRPANFSVINPDDVKEMMVRNGMDLPVEGLSPLETSPLLHEESSDLSKRHAAEVVLEGTNALYDITFGGTADHIRRKHLDELAAHGYQVDLVLVSVPGDVSLEAARTRWLNGLGRWSENPATDPGGRYVPSGEIAKNVIADPARQGLGPHDRSRNQENWYELRHHPAVRRAVLITREGKDMRVVYDTADPDRQPPA